MTETRYENTTGPTRVPPKDRGSGFMMGLFGGALIGAAAGVFFAPQVQAALRNLRRQMTDAAADASDAAKERYRDATTQMGDAVDDLQQKGRDVYGNALSVVVRGAEAIQERATAAQTELEQRSADATRRSL